MGKVITCSLSSMHLYPADVKYFIVLRPGKVKVKGLRHKPDLAPSQELFTWAQAHKHEPDWFQHYATWFKKDMVERPGLRNALARLEETAKEKDILLVCFCANPEECHRGLIADELERRGVNVEKH